ncbi:MAG: Ig-like domain-containing protein [Lachnospiraceae bacterium]|nr:Ig-like domain-containing protein [Lachnospiraceae bacterium]
MINKKLYHILSFLLCISLLSSAIPNTVIAAELYDKNDISVINDDLEKTLSEDAQSKESTTEYESESSMDAAESNSETESKSTTYIEQETESMSETEFESEMNTGSEEAPDSNFEADTEVETESESETESDTTLASEPETESESENETECDVQAAVDAFHLLAAEKPLMALLYHTESYKVCQEPSKDSNSVATIESGHTLYVKAVEILDDSVWYQVQFGLNGTEYTGYVESYYLAYSDEDWISWETDYLTGAISPYTLNSGIDTSDIEAFPVYYRDKLAALKELHPNWTFVPMNTGLDFNTVIANEMGEKSLIQNTTSNAEKGWVGKAYGGGWYYATEDAVSYYMNPCNFLTESYIFQFEQLTFNDSYHTVSAIQSFLNNTFMRGSLPDDSNKTYAQAFYEIGKSRILSPIHLAARVYQEQGNGTSALISGTYNGYQGYYNYFNVSASGTTTQQIIESGLSYAKSKGWNTHYKSLSGGAATIGNNYILKGQDTLYLEKFNVDGNYNPLYTHQYMQNIQAPASESLSTRKMYANAGSLDSAFVFKIPVFYNMQEEKHLESISLDKATLILQTQGSLTGNPTDHDVEDTLTVRYNPTDTTDEISVKWNSSDTDVVTVAASDDSNTALVTAAGEGSATITATATTADAETGNVIVKTAVCQITVIAPASTIERSAIIFMDKDDTTILARIEVPYEGSIAESDIPEISVNDDELFIGWFTGKGGKGTWFDSTTILSAEETIVYPYCEKQGKGFYVLPISDYVYTGSVIKPEVRVFDSLINEDGSYRLIALEKGQDYSVSYKNNKSVNTADSASPTVIIKGKGNYTGTEYAYFNILPKPLIDKDISVENITTAYNGKLQKLTPTVYRSGKKLSVKKDFTVSYPDIRNGAYMNAGTYPITIEGTGGYSGTLTIYQKITSDILMSKAKVGKIPNQTYDESLVNSGYGMVPEAITVTYGNRTLENGKDYSVRYVNHLSVGTATAYITAINGSGFSGTKAVTYKIVGLPINKAVVSGITSKAYTGNENDVLQGNVSLSLDGTALREGIDYTVSYANTSKTGTAAIIFKGINGYSGQLKKTYKITPLDISDDAITMTYVTQDAPDVPIKIESLSEITSPYMKGSTCPNVQLYLNGIPLTKGKDYTIKYTNNNQITTSVIEDQKHPTITVTGKGNFMGSLSGTWNITDGAFDSANNKVKLILKDVVYKNAPNKFKSSVTLTDANGAKLSAGKDYDKSVTFSYAQDTTVPTATGGEVYRESGALVDAADIPNAGTIIRVTAKGTGAYEGNGNAVISGTYRITSSDLSKAKVSVKAKIYQNGDAVTLSPDDIQITLNGTVLLYGNDYIIDSSTYTNNLKKGKASVVLKGLNGNYGGEKKITFTIGSKMLVWWKNLY